MGKIATYVLAFLGLASLIGCAPKEQGPLEKKLAEISRVTGSSGEITLKRVENYEPNDECGYDIKQGFLLKVPVEIRGYPGLDQDTLFYFQREGSSFVMKDIPEDLRDTHFRTGWSLGVEYTGGGNLLEL